MAREAASIASLLRKIDWFESTNRSLGAVLPKEADCAPLLTERLSALLLERLPEGLREELLELLPDATAASTPSLRAVLGSRRETSIGFPAFVERARHALGMSEILDTPEYADSEENYQRLCQKAAERFLWAIAQELPAELKARMADALPLDLRSRMNLYSAYSDDAKVA